MVLGDTREGLDSSVAHEEDEEELLKQAIALSLEGETENGSEGEYNNAEEDGEEEDEELILRQVIALGRDSGGR